MDNVCHDANYMNNKPKKAIDREVFDQFCHDLKNPLTTMRCNLDLIKLNKSDKLDPKTQNLIKVINKEIDHIIKIIADASRA